MAKICLKLEVFVINFINLVFLLPDSCHTDTQISIPKSISEMKQLMENTSVQSGPGVLVQLDQIFPLTTSKPDELENARTLHFDASLSLYSV